MAGSGSARRGAWSAARALCAKDSVIEGTEAHSGKDGRTPVAEQIVETLYYVDAFCDERLPCEPTLEGWAQWLQFGGNDAAGDGGCDHPLLRDGDTVTLSCLDLHADLRLRKGAWDRPPPADANFFAVRFGPGQGWDAETIADDPETLLDGVLDAEEETLIAVGRFGAKRAARFRVLGKVPVLLLEEHGR